jgi:D-Tyr-tRNA(Tyr) deacylase
LSGFYLRLASPLFRPFLLSCIIAEKPGLARKTSSNQNPCSPGRHDYLKCLWPVKKGNRPSFSRSARPETALPLYEQFLRRLEADFGRPVAAGEFGADMEVSLVNEGPVTIIIDSKNPE